MSVQSSLNDPKLTTKSLLESINAEARSIKSIETRIKSKPQNVLQIVDLDSLNSSREKVNGYIREFKTLTERKYHEEFRFSADYCKLLLTRLQAAKVFADKCETLKTQIQETSNDKQLTKLKKQVAALFEVSIGLTKEKKYYKKIYQEQEKALQELLKAQHASFTIIDNNNNTSKPKGSKSKSQPENSSEPFLG